MFQFGVGGLWGNPVGGNLATPSGPVQFGTLQDVNIDVDQQLVELRGQYKFPDDVAPGNMTIKGKSATGKVEIDTYNSLFFGETIASGISIIENNESRSVPATSTFTITATHSTTFTTDLGVLYAATGAPFQLIPEVLVNNEAHAIPGTPYQVTVTGSATFFADHGVTTDLGVALVKVGSGPTTGQYSVNTATGVYTFAAADTTDNVLISYGTKAVPTIGKYEVNAATGVYTFAAADASAAVLLSYIYTSTSSRTLPINNKIMGYGPVFELYLSMAYQGNNGLHLFACRASKMSMPLKRDNYLIQDFEFEAYANAAGHVAEIYQVSA